MLDYSMIISCEHGGNELPEAYTALFQGHGPMLASHRGWDPGALPVAKELASLFDAPLFFTTISRLLIDTNRSPTHRNLFSETSRHLSSMEKEHIIEQHYLPHRRQIYEEIETLLDRGAAVLHLAIHSFTPI
ncbi:MAG: N-formylglutamate amidohydrolase, partial [Desulfobulbaceae bacterium]|nr:N-formylglutamate amidohydrolase [Desulfobulbaceae bacterium]